MLLFIPVVRAITEQVVSGWNAPVKARAETLVMAALSKEREATICRGVVDEIEASMVPALNSYQRVLG